MAGIYAKLGGVDYTKMGPFKRAMQRVAAATAEFTREKGVIVAPLDHGVYWERKGDNHGYITTLEGLGNKDWIAEWMYVHDPAGGSRYDRIAQCFIMMAANDGGAHGGDPIILTDEVITGTSEWFEDERRSLDFARGVLDVCKDLGMTLGGGESAPYKYLHRSRFPVKDAPALTANVIGILNPKTRLITGEKLRPGDQILGFLTPSACANGFSLIIAKGKHLKDKFLTPLPSGRTYGDVALDPTPSYAPLVQALLNAGVKAHAFLPITGGGVSKIAFADREYTYKIHRWPEVEQMSEVVQHLIKRCRISRRDIATTFNCGVGFIGYFPKRSLERAMEVGRGAGYTPMHLGEVALGKRGVLFGPWDNMWLDPPAE